MDDTEIDRLKKTIRRSFGNSPHKKKYWLALLEMHVASEKEKEPPRPEAGEGINARWAIG